MKPSLNAVPLHVFDDQRGRFGPLTDRRPVFSLLAGIISQRVRIETALAQMAAALHLDPLLAATRHETDARLNPSAAFGGPVTFHIRALDDQWSPVEVRDPTAALLVSGRWIGDGPTVARVRELAPGHALVDPSGDLVAAHLTATDAQRVIDSGFTDLPDAADVQTLDEPALLSRPWHLLDQLPRLVTADLAHHAGVHAEAIVHPSAVLDETQGPIGIAAGAIIGPLAVLEGPCWIGPGSKVNAHAHIRPHTVISDHCKIGGEVSASIVYPQSNKSHYGYLGDSIVGSWCNLGAGTTISNLKNTYGIVRTQLAADGGPEDTGRQFQGPIVGDFVRTAIGTRLVTGSCIGTACCIAQSAMTPKFVPPLTFLTDAGRQPYAFDSFLRHANTAMERRGHRLTDAEVAVLRRLVQQTA